VAAERVPIESAHVLMFARAIGDENPAYRDPDAPEARAAGGVLAPPTFLIADIHFDPESRLRPQPGEAWRGSGREPTPPRPPGEAGESGGALALHAEQHYAFVRPVLVGDVLTKSVRAGESWEREGRRGGTMRFRETIAEYRDAAGELVATARSVTVVTERNPAS
jgi:acyl dehydratase